MSALILTGKPPGGKRLILADVLPLDTPLVIQIFPIYACNQACGFCHFSIPAEKRGFVSGNLMMLGKLFVKCIDDMKGFPNKTRVLRFVGMGEPLLHPDISQMVKYAAASGVADKTEIVTNGTLLTRDMAFRLSDAGLDRLVVSAQDTSLVEKVRYMHSFGRTHIHVKIIDCCLKKPEDEQMFYDAYEDACDSIGVEYAGPIYPGVTFNNTVSPDRTQYGARRSNPRVCPQPFATMQINPDGNVVPCYSIDYPEISGDANSESLPEIWNGKKLRKFRLKMLDGKEGASKACNICEILNHRMYPEDSLDEAADKLKGALHGEV